MNDRLNGIVAFVQAVESESFALAAVRMHLSRSAVGKTIARLEQRLGVRLFHRTTRRQSLTEEGQIFYERCIRVLTELDAAEAALDSGHREPGGRLRVSVPVLFGRQCVAPVLLSLTRKYPRLSVEISFSDRVIDLVEEGVDLAVRIGPLADSVSLATRRLGTQNMAICAAPTYLSEHGRPASVDDFEQHKGIIYTRAASDLAWRIRDADGCIRELRVDSRIRMDDLQAIADAAVAGLGLAWLPCWMLARYVRSGELELVMDSQRVLSTEMHAIWPQTLYLPSKTRVAIDALVAEVPKSIGLEQDSCPIG
jgi:DNA-binding transcriptional LysR family regulator